MHIPDEIARLIEESRAQERSGKLAAAIQQAQQARRLAISQAHLEAEATALNILAYSHIRLGHYEQARQFCILALERAGSESQARAEALLNLGICAGETNDLAALEKLTLQAVDLSRQIGCDRVLVRGLHALSCGIYMPRGQFALSLAMDEEALNIARSRDLAELVWGPLLTMTWVHWQSGQPHLAETRLSDLQQVVSPGSLGDGYWHFIHANLALEAGDVTRARELFTKTFSIAEANGISENLYLARWGMCTLSRALQDGPTALAWANEALAVVENSGYQHLQGQALIERARTDWALGNLSAAEEDLRAAIERLAPQRYDFDLATALLLQAALLRQQSRPEAAAAWREAAFHLIQGGFSHLVERERALSYPLIAAGLKSRERALAEASAVLLERLQRIPPPALMIATLGGWQVRVGRREVVSQSLRQRRSGELLGLLLISPGRTLSFDQVSEALWPDKDPVAAQILFHHATSTLRRVLEPDLPDKFPSRYLEVTEGQVSLQLPPASIIDYETFAAHCRREEWAQALACYGGEFLPQYRYAEWAIAHWQWLTQYYQLTLLKMAETWLAEARHAEALDACQKILATEPWQEQAVLLGMRACLGLGNRSGALRLYKSLEKRLRTELGIEPQPELQSFYQAMILPR